MTRNIIVAKNGIATGTSGNDDLVVNGAGQTLVGNGDNDVFDIGSYAGTKIVVGSGGITAVRTSASTYRLADGVDDLVASGGSAHVISGNGRNNLITGSNANDTISGGGGNVVIQVGTGANQLTGGGKYDTFAFLTPADHNNVITDFKAGYDVLDLRKVFAVGSFDTTQPDTYLKLTQSGANTVMSVASNASGAGSHVLVTLNQVQAISLVAGTDYIFA